MAEKIYKIDLNSDINVERIIKGIQILLLCNHAETARDLFNKYYHLFKIKNFAKVIPLAVEISALLNQPFDVIFPNVEVNDDLLDKLLSFTLIKNPLLNSKQSEIEKNKKMIDKIKRIDKNIRSNDLEKFLNAMNEYKEMPIYKDAELSFLLFDAFNSRKSFDYFKATLFISLVKSKFSEPLFFNNNDKYYIINCDKFAYKYDNYLIRISQYLLSKAKFYTNPVLFQKINEYFMYYVLITLPELISDENYASLLVAVTNLVYDSLSPNEEKPSFINSLFYNKEEANKIINVIKKSDNIL